MKAAITHHKPALAILFLLTFLVSMTASAMYLQPRIVGGEDVVPGDYPWMVALAFENDPDYDDFLTGAGGCGGTHIGDGWIVTANHCLNFEIRDNDQNYIDFERKTEHITVKLGDDHTEVGPDSANRHFDVIEFVSHPDNPANQALNQHDIALLRIDTDTGNAGLLQDAATLASPLVDYEVSQHEEPVRLIGWGQQGVPSEDASPALQKIDQFIIENQACNDEFGAMTWHAHYVCARVMDESSGAGGFSGDSGGPLLAQDENDNWVQLGVYSFSSLGNPDVHIRVAHHLDWINDVTGLDFDTTPAPESASESGGSESSGTVHPLLLLALLGVVAVRLRRGVF